MRSLGWALICVGLVACGKGEGSGDPTDTDEPSDTDDPTDTDDPSDTDDPEALPDLYEEMNPDHCKAGAYYNPDLNIGVAYFVGDFYLDGAEISGTESMVIFFNETATENLQMSSCETVWHVTGSQVDPVLCAGCDYGVDLALTADFGVSDCPEPIWSDFATADVIYDVALDEDGTTSVYFTTSGDLLGSGHAGGGRITYLSAPSCMIF